MKIIRDTKLFGQSVKAFTAMHGSRGDQDGFRLSVTASALFHGLAHGNFDAIERVSKAAPGFMRPDIKRAWTEARDVFDANGKLEPDLAAMESERIMGAVRDGLTEYRDEQDRAKAEKKEAKEAAEREAAIAAREAEGKGKPSPFMLKGTGETLELTEDEYAAAVDAVLNYRVRQSETAKAEQQEHALEIAA